MGRVEEELRDLERRGCEDLGRALNLHRRAGDYLAAVGYLAGYLAEEAGSHGRAFGERIQRATVKGVGAVVVPTVGENIGERCRVLWAGVWNARRGTGKADRLLIAPLSAGVDWHPRRGYVTGPRAHGEFLYADDVEEATSQEDARELLGLLEEWLLDHLALERLEGVRTVVLTQTIGERGEGNPMQEGARGYLSWKGRTGAGNWPRVGFRILTELADGTWQRSHQTHWLEAHYVTRAPRISRRKSCARYNVRRV